MEFKAFSFKMSIQPIDYKVGKIRVLPADDLVIVDFVIFMHIPSGGEKSANAPSKATFAGYTSDKLSTTFQYSLNFNKITIKRI